jgi:hypothetical protein
MPKQWTPEERAAFGEKMRALKAAHAANPPAAVASPPVVNEAVPVPPPRPRTTRDRGAKPKPSPALPPQHPVGANRVANLCGDLSSLPLEALSFEQCGQLINACSAAITALSTARRLKQEALDAGTHKAPCSNCGRMIDITKSGGFQILTVRDEYHQPKNVYFCSQNCLLARGMPSHAKQTPKQKTGATA